MAYSTLRSQCCASVSWGGLINIGREPDVTERERFMGTKGLIYRIGFTSKRISNLGEQSIEILCSVLKSDAHGIPLFQCSSNSILDNAPLTVSSTNPTKVVSKIMRLLQHKTSHKWSGNDFFGFRRNDVLKKIANAVTGTNTDYVISWKGVVTYGSPILNDLRYIFSSGTNKLRLQPGFESVRDVGSTPIHCKIVSTPTGPEFRCETECGTHFHQSTKPTIAMNEVFKTLGIVKTRNRSGYEFFGFNRSDVIAVIKMPLTLHKDPEKLVNSVKDSELECGTSKKCRNSFEKLSAIIDRNAGPTSSLSSTKSQIARNKTIHEAVKLASFNDVKNYVTFLCEKHPDIIDEGIKASEKYVSHLSNILEASTAHITLTLRDTAELLLGKCNLSQRSYKTLKKILKAKSVNLPQYYNVVSYINELHIGELKDQPDHGGCMCVSTSLKETLQLMIDSGLYSLFSFKNQEEQERIFNFLKRNNSELYQNIDMTRRTFFLRETGDNFRASARFPTEQISFSILNLKELLSSPYGQFVSCLWRGSESRENLVKHLTLHYEELSDAVKNGIELVVDDAIERFNVIVFLCTDLGLLQKILGKCSSTSRFGCFWCKKELSKWSDTTATKANLQTIVTMNTHGEDALKKLGENPLHTTTVFTKFQQGHFGQYAPPLFHGFITETMCPCGLHCILANHRYLWKYFFHVIDKRKQEKLIPYALREIGCTYLAYQYESYFKSKQKQYDGSSTLKLIGNDCKLLELNIKKLLVVFLKEVEKEEWDHKTFEKMRHVEKLYRLFADLAQDIRSVTYNADRALSFNNRAENFFLKLKHWAGGNFVYGLPYLHILKEHIGNLMVLWGDLMGWGYGYFSCTSGEHLNKLIKTMEVEHTNLDTKRFETIVKLLRVKQLHYPNTILPSTNEVKCSRCNQTGHNKKNKSCHMHPSQPALFFDESEDET